ncbi:hypothetical protein [Flavobacterium sp. N2270]|uniref:hypothetical protein n=1 Tax=Flavobacterium sp. N2270 TaxID=2986831 RepID=UPI002224FFC6|nr:hypothetical protein [Flavobacterium sp. N2270]
MKNIELPILDTTFVENLIPQKAPFVMVDKLLLFEENKIVAGLTVSNKNIFTSNEVFQESGLVEHMAQSVALYTGYQYFLKNEPAPTGYIGSIKTIQINRLPKLNEQVETSVTVLQEFMGVTLVDIISRVNNEVIGTSQMKTVLAS